MSLTISVTHLQNRKIASTVCAKISPSMPNAPLFTVSGDVSVADYFYNF